VRCWPVWSKRNSKNVGPKAQFGLIQTSHGEPDWRPINPSVGEHSWVDNAEGTSTKREHARQNKANVFFIKRREGEEGMIVGFKLTIGSCQKLRERIFQAG